MDDMQYVLRCQDFTKRFGLWRGILENFSSHLEGDRSWGLFRPAYSFYSSTVYLLAPNVVYFMRFLTFSGIFVFSLLFVQNIADRAGKPPARLYYGLLILALLAIHSLYDGLGFISLQEPSGLCLAACGLYLFASARPGATPWFAALCFLFAAWFKTPFIWLLLGAGVFNVLVLKKRLLGLLSVLAALTNIAVAASFARSGGYTAHFTALKPGLMRETLIHFAGEFAVPALISLLALAAGLRYRRREFFSGDRYAALVGGTGALYLVNLLPWGSPNYHMGPPAYLLTLGLFIFLAPRFEFRPGRSGLVAGATVLGLAVCGHGFWKCLARDQTIQALRDWALALPQDGAVLALNGPESSGRFRELLTLRSHGKWNSPVVELPASGEGSFEGGAPSPHSPAYYIVFSDQGAGNSKFMSTPIAHFPLATVYRLK